jgi:hypothetical protein
LIDAFCFNMLSLVVPAKAWIDFAKEADHISQSQESVDAPGWITASLGLQMTNDPVLHRISDVEGRLQ